jgi:hypothetical protein
MHFQSARTKDKFTMNRHWLRASLLVVLLGVLSSSWLSAQVLYGTLTGTVQDKSGAVIPDATVTMTNQETGDARTAQADSHGNYRFVNLLPAHYTIRIAATTNFSGFLEKDVTVEVNREARVDIALQPPSVTQEVVVNGTVPTLQTETAEVNHEISQAEIAELPITSSQGRNYQSLYTLIPGFAAVGEQNSTASNPSRAESANVNGTEDMGVTTRIDGAVNTYGWLPYLVAYVPPADSIQSVNIVTNSFNAEQGMAGGAAVSVTIKGGQHDFHGSVWEYNQIFNTNARGYTQTVASGIVSVPKNIFNEFGGSIGGPVYIPHILTGKKKLFFFDAFERTTRRQLITGTQTVPTAAMIGGDFSSVAGLTNVPAATILYDPQPGGVGPFLPVGARPTFMSEYGCNCIPNTRIAPQAAKMLQLLQPISNIVGTPSAAALNNQLANDYNGSGTFSYNRNTNDAKITFSPSDATTIFGRYSIEPFTVTDPQELGAAGGGTFDGGQPGAAAGRIQNIGIGASHIITPRLVVDADFGYTRQNTGAQSLIDIAAGNFGLDTLGIPGTNGVGSLYAGQPAFEFSTNNYSSNTFSSLGNSNGANPFLFRDNQFTADANVSWSIGKHSTKYGFSYYHFDLNHFQPTSGANINTPHGGFGFAGGMTTGPLDRASATDTVGNNTNAYTTFADYLLGLPNNGTNPAIAHPYQLSNPNSLRWTTLSAYAQDQWQVSSKFTLNYGVRWEFYPAPYRDHSGVYRLDPSLPQSANVEIGGVAGNPQNAGISMPEANFTPRLGISYRATERLVIRAGGGITTDPDSLRFLRDSFPIDQTPTFSGTTADSIAINPANGQALTLAVGIPNPSVPNLSTGFASLPVSGATNTTPANYRRGYIESWNLFVQQDLGHSFVMNVGYVGTHQVRQLAGYTLNAAPLPSASTVCTSAGTYSAASGLTGACNFAANELVNTNAHCNAVTGYTCYNTGGITMNQPIFSSNYNALQSQLTRNAGRLAQFGLIYTWSHAFDYDDNGAGSGSNGTAFSYPAYFKLNRATASYDRTNNVQFWGIYHLPFGAGQTYVNHGILSAIIGGIQLNGQISHVSGAPFSVTPSTTTGFNSPGNTLYADLVKPYHQLSGHSRTPGNNAISGGLPWFDPTSFANPIETIGGVNVPHFGNTHRNQFRGPGVSGVNASAFRDIHIFREAQFKLGVEAFNLLNHAQLTSNPNATVGGGTFGYITTFATNAPQAPRSLQFSGRINF